MELVPVLRTIEVQEGWQIGVVSVLLRDRLVWLRVTHRGRPADVPVVAWSATDADTGTDSICGGGGGGGGGSGDPLRFNTTVDWAFVFSVRPRAIDIAAADPDGRVVISETVDLISSTPDTAPPRLELLETRTGAVGIDPLERAVIDAAGLDRRTRVLPDRLQPLAHQVQQTPVGAVTFIAAEYWPHHKVLRYVLEPIDEDDHPPKRHIWLVTDPDHGTAHATVVRSGSNPILAAHHGDLAFVTTTLESVETPSRDRAP